MSILESHSRISRRAGATAPAHAGAVTAPRPPVAPMRAGGAGAADGAPTPSVPAGADSSAQPSGTRRRLDHIDAMRPVKQIGVLGTHSVIAYGHGVFFGAALVLLHVSREGFLFVSACMLTYAYRDFRHAQLGAFWKRRAVMVLVPYLTWTAIYFFIGLPGMHGSAWDDVGQLAKLTVVGYSQLYFIVVLVQFYLLFPLVLALLRRTEGHHGLLVAASVLIQLVYTSLMHWNLLPGWLGQGTTATREVTSYQFYLLAGCVAAWHYDALHAFVLRHSRAIAWATLGTATLAELWYFLAQDRILSGLGSNSSDPFMPIVLPFNVAAIGLIYVIGIKLVKPRRRDTLRRVAHSGSDNSFAIYLSQVAFLDLLTGLGWGRLDEFVPWPVTVVGAVIVIYLCGTALGAVFCRLPGARAITGRRREPWPFAGRRRPHGPEAPAGGPLAGGPLAGGPLAGGALNEGAEVAPAAFVSLLRGDQRQAERGAGGRGSSRSPWWPGRPCWAPGPAARC